MRVNVLEVVAAAHHGGIVKTRHVAIFRRCRRLPPPPERVAAAALFAVLQSKVTVRSAQFAALLDGAPLVELLRRTNWEVAPLLVAFVDVTPERRRAREGDAGVFHRDDVLLHAGAFTTS